MFDQCRLGKEIALCDSGGRIHVASISSEMPSVGTDLSGLQATRGLGTVLATTRGQTYRVTFEIVDCGLESAFERLHPNSSIHYKPRVFSRARRG